MRGPHIHPTECMGSRLGGRGQSCPSAHRAASTPQSLWDRLSQPGLPSPLSLLIPENSSAGFCLAKTSPDLPTAADWQPTVKSKCPSPKLKPLLSQVQAKSFPSGLISPCFLLISKSLRAWRWLGGVNSPVSVACCPVLAAGVWGNVFPWALQQRVPDRGCEVEQPVLPSTLLEITSKKAPEVQHQADKTM